jgi:SOS-response transcriptional repressor LexA
MNILFSPSNKFHTMSEHFVQRLAFLSAALGIRSKAELAEKLGIGRTTLYYYEKDPTQVPEQFIRTLEDLEEKAFKGNEQTVQHPVFQEESPIYSRNRMIPVVGMAHAGEAENYEELPAHWQRKIATDCRDPKAFALVLEGDSMARDYLDGDVLVVQPTMQAFNGCPSVCKFKNETVVFRMVEFFPDRIRLVALNLLFPATEHSLDAFSWIYPVWSSHRQVWKR